MLEYHIINDDTEEGHYLVMSKSSNNPEDVLVHGTIEEVDPGFHSDNEFLQKKIDEFIERKNLDSIEERDKDRERFRFLYEDLDKAERIQKKLFPEFTFRR